MSFTSHHREALWAYVRPAAPKHHAFVTPMHDSCVGVRRVEWKRGLWGESELSAHGRAVPVTADSERI